MYKNLATVNEPHDGVRGTLNSVTIGRQVILRR